MRPHELRELLESRREYATSEASSQRITEIQEDMDFLENEYEQEIRDLLNGTGYNLEGVSFNIDILREIITHEPHERLLTPINGD
jgi:phage anti-repressor protein